MNKYGFIETPYLRVAKTIRPEGDPARLVGRTVRADVPDPRTGEVIVARGEVITAERAQRLTGLGDIEIPVRPYVTDQVDYLTADEEERYVIAQANVQLNDVHEFLEPRLSVRYHANFLEEAPERVDYIDVSP
ncbi:MAG: DNA-directed RNA polymerase subunit beta, partial [Chloroflexota bacterium]